MSLDWERALQETIEHWGGIYVSMTRDSNVHGLLRTSADCPMCRAAQGKCSKCIVPEFMVVMGYEGLPEKHACLELPELRNFYAAVEHLLPDEVYARLGELVKLANKGAKWLESRKLVAGWINSIYVNPISGEVTAEVCTSIGSKFSIVIGHSCPIPISG